MGECYIGPFCFFYSLFERTFFSFFLFHFCFSQSIWKNANCQSGLGRFRQSVPPAESPGEQTNAVIHYSPGLGLFWVAQRFNFQWKVELGKLTICKEGQTHGSWRPVKWKKISIIFFSSHVQRGRSSGTICTHLTHAFLDDLKVHFLHAMVLPLSLKAFLLENFHVWGSKGK